MASRLAMARAVQQQAEAHAPTRPTAKKKRTKLADPWQREQAEAAAAVPELPPDLATLPEDLHYRRERMYAIAAACRFERWLLEHIAARGIPRDDVNRPVTLLPIYVEAMLLARVIYPSVAPIEVDDAEDAFWTPETESEAVAAGLTVRRNRRGEKRPAANLPGCAGEGGACIGLRRYGERYCPACRRKELERMRREV